MPLELLHLPCYEGLCGTQSTFLVVSRLHWEFSILFIATWLFDCDFQWFNPLSQLLSEVVCRHWRRALSISSKFLWVIVFNWQASTSFKPAQGHAFIVLPRFQLQVLSVTTSYLRCQSLFLVCWSTIEGLLTPHEAIHSQYWVTCFTFSRSHLTSRKSCFWPI